MIKNNHYNDHHNDDDDYANDDDRTFVSLTKVTIAIVTKSDNYVLKVSSISSETEGGTLYTLTILSV